MSRINETCVSAEDIRIQIDGVNKLSIIFQSHGLLKIRKNDESWVGYIIYNVTSEHFGLFINTITIFGNIELSNKLTNEYRNKILITSNYIDDVKILKELKQNTMQNNCVTSEDLRIATNSEKIFYYQQGGVGPYFIRNRDWIGHIDDYIRILGADTVINKIVMRDDKELELKLSRDQTFLGKMLIWSKITDDY